MSGTSFHELIASCLSVLSEPERGSLTVIATVFDKLNHEYKKYLEAEQNYTLVSGLYPYF